VDVWGGGTGKGGKGKGNGKVSLILGPRRSGEGDSDGVKRRQSPSSKSTSREPCADYLNTVACT
jgi:hypothetical protein